MSNSTELKISLVIFECSGTFCEGVTGLHGHLHARDFNQSETSEGFASKMEGRNIIKIVRKAYLSCNPLSQQENIFNQVLLDLESSSLPEEPAEKTEAGEEEIYTN